jgi:hypothetical protein
VSLGQLSEQVREKVAFEAEVVRVSSPWELELARFAIFGIQGTTANAVQMATRIRFRVCSPLICRILVLKRRAYSCSPPWSVFRFGPPKTRQLELLRAL